MNESDIKQAVFEALGEIAPELDPATFDTGAPLREEADLDSMDFLNFVVALHDRLGIDIPEADYAKLASVDDCAVYLAERL